MLQGLTARRVAWMGSMSGYCRWRVLSAELYSTLVPLHSIAWPLTLTSPNAVIGEKRHPLCLSSADINSSYRRNTVDLFRRTWRMPCPRRKHRPVRSPRPLSATFRVPQKQPVRANAFMPSRWQRQFDVPRGKMKPVFQAAGRVTR